MWFVFGYERLIISDKQIIASKSNKIFTIQKKYQLSEIKRASIRKKMFETNRFIDVQRERIREKQKALFFWINMGKIELQFNYYTKTVLNGISDIEAEKVVIRIDEAINNLKIESN